MINVNVVTSSPTNAHQFAIPLGENGLLASEPSLTQQVLDLHKADKKPGSVARVLLGQSVALVVGVGANYKPKDFAAAAVRSASDKAVLVLHAANAEEAKAFAVTVYDPDAPTGSGWWHWLAINIPADVQALAANAGAIGGANLPKGASHGRSDFGFAGWGGVCPPQGGMPHRYIFTVHALKAPLEVPADATAALTGYFMGMNTIAKASFTATYNRAAAK